MGQMIGQDKLIVEFKKLNYTTIYVIEPIIYSFNHVNLSIANLQ